MNVTNWDDVQPIVSTSVGANSLNNIPTDWQNKATDLSTWITCSSKKDSWMYYIDPCQKFLRISPHTHNNIPTDWQNKATDLDHMLFLKGLSIELHWPLPKF